MNVAAAGRSAALLSVAALLCFSCTKIGSMRLSDIDEYCLREGTIAVPSDSDLVLKGRMRVEIPEFRLRGVVRMIFSGKGGMRLDFHHSSALGAYEEDFSVLIDGTDVFILDRKRDILYRGEDARRVMKERLPLELDSDDPFYLLLVRKMTQEELESPRYMTDGHRWILTAAFKERDIRLEGVAGGRVELFRQCFGGKCFSIRYRDYREYRWGSYPSVIYLSSDVGDMRLRIEVEEITEVPHEPEEFDLRGMLFSDAPCNAPGKMRSLTLFMRTRMEPVRP